jgi:hypothetical protein
VNLSGLSVRLAVGLERIRVEQPPKQPPSYVIGLMPATSVERSVMDVLSTTHRTDIARMAITDALRSGLLNASQANRLRRLITRSTLEHSRSTKRSVQLGLFIRKENR